MRPAFFAAAARPFLRKRSTAFSMSPRASASIVLQSIIGAPVRSRSCLTICAVTSMLVLSLARTTQTKEKVRSTRVRLTSSQRAPPPIGGRRPIWVACRSGGGRAAGATRAAGRSRRATRRRRVLVEHRQAAAGAAVLLPRHRLLLELAGALDVGVGDARREQPDGADGVVVARDDVVDQLRVAIRVHHRDHRDAELVGLGDGDVLLLRVDHEERIGQLVHVADALEVLRHPVVLALEAQPLLLRQRAVLVAQPRLDVLQALDRGAQGHEIRQRAAQPAVGDRELAAALRLFGDRLLRLPLGADEQDALALRREIAHEVRDLLEQLQGLLQVDDVDPVPLAEDVRLHLRVPAPGLVAEMNAGLQQLLHGDFYQARSPSSALAPAQSAAGPINSVMGVMSVMGVASRAGGSPMRRACSRNDQRLLNWKRARAPFWPYFLRSFFRGSRVTRPADFNRSRSSALYSISAREMPWRMAPACPALPPPSTVATMSNFSAVSVSSNGCLMTIFSTSFGK